MDWVSNSHAAAILADSICRTLDCTREAYLAHADGSSVVPRSMLVQVPRSERDRFIALPAFLTRPTGNTVGIKWIGSFPENLHRGQPRASAIIVLNSPHDGRPQAVLDGAAISAARTGASAAIAAQALGGLAGDGITLVGAGPINSSVFRYVRHLSPTLRSVRIFDPQDDSAQRLRDSIVECPGISVEVCRSLDSALDGARLISLATNVVVPYLDDLSVCDPAAVVLHVSLRDIEPQALVECSNVTDDVGHVLSANTSLHLLQQTGGAPFPELDTLGEVLRDGAWHGDGRTVFSPFGLGSLDIAVADFVLGDARRRGLAISLSE